ncbi:hypothetical protein EsH8_II_001177 [Colletotrichum jinshuiense]
MPPTQLKASHDLSIQLLTPHIPLHPGSVILGHIVRKSHIVTPAATVRVRLLGRAKAKLVIERGNNNKSYYRSRFNFWPESAITHVVHEGPVHVAPGGDAQSWPFALELPTHTDAASVNACGGDKAREACFLRQPGSAGAAAGIPSQPLPATFFFDNSSFSKHWHGFVEYWIQAELVENGRSKIISASLPLKVFSPLTPAPPISDFGLLTRNMAGCVSSQRLMPGMEEADLSFKQKTQKFFGSSKVPTFHYTLHVQFPTVIQLGNESTVPFLLHLTPNREKTTDVIEDVPQTVTVKYVDLELQSTTGVICPGTLDSHEASKTRKLCLGKISEYLKPVGGPLVLPCSGKGDPVDVGAVLGLHVDAFGRIVNTARHGPGGSTTNLTVLPTFVTYCIKTEHVLQWEVQILVAGETWKCEGNQKVLLLAPCEDMASGRAEASGSASRSAAPPPADAEDVPAYDGPSGAAPAYERIPGDGSAEPSTVGGKS